MPLSVIRRKDTQTLYISGTICPAGSAARYRVRQRAGTDDQTLAQEEAAAIEREILRNHHHGNRPIERGFAAAVTSYCQAEPRAPQTVDLVGKLLRHLGNMPLRQITQDVMDEACRALLPESAKPGTKRRNVIVPLRAVLNFGARRGWNDAPHFELPREPEGRTAFLLPDQFEAIYAAATQRVRPLLRFLVCTGCRLGETLALDWSQVDLQAARVRLWGDQTKTGRRFVVDLPPAAVAALATLPGARTGRVFRSRYRDADGEPLPYRATADGGGGQIKTGLASACERAGVPAIGAHVFRHSFASWHWALHRDLIALKVAGRWASLALVERYAHLMPAGQEDAIRRSWGIGELVVVERARA